MAKLKRRIARSLVTVISLSLFTSIGVNPKFLPPASAAVVTTGTCTVDGTNIATSNIIDSTTVDGTCMIRLTSGTSSIVVPAGINSVAALVVGGGGGGGFGGLGGGGGAGSVISSTSGVLVSSGAEISASIGGGGAAGINSANTGNQSFWRNGFNGEATTLTIAGNSFVASGGGAGGGLNTPNGSNGGSGGGAASGGTRGTAYNIDYPGWSESASAGFSPSGEGGGGGGAKTAATSANGAEGVTIFGYKVGGGGSGYPNGVSTVARPFGGGSSRDSSFNCTSNLCNGIANTGGGGGGGGAGGSGVVVIKFLPARGQGTIAQSNGFQFNRSSTFTFTRTGTVPTSTSATYQWQVKPAGSSAWSNVTTGTGGTSTTYQTPILSSSDSGSTYRIAVTDTQATYGISTTTYVETSVQNLFTPPGSDTDTALYFDGSNYVKVADSNEVDFANNFTFQAWVKPETMTSYGMILNKEDSIEFYISGGYFGIAAQKALNQWGYFQTAVPATVNQWQHIAYTRAANSTTVNVYLNGILSWSGVIDTDFNGTPFNTSYPLMIGGRSTSGNGALFDPSFKGQIDHLAVFSTVRTQTEIQSDLKSYISPTATGLQLYYDFNEGSGTTLYNRKSGSTAASDMILSPTPPTWIDVKEVSTPANSPYTITKFTRTYINSSGGWRAPANITKLSALVVAGGGGGGSRHGGGGGAGGIGYGGSYPVNSNQIYQVNVGFGGLGYGYLGYNAYIDGAGTLYESRVGPAGGIGARGENSFFKALSSNTDSITALGGGGGSGSGATGSGGSGGGSNQSVVGGTATQYSGSNWVGYGSAGGQGSAGSCANDWCGGGGGGAGAAGSAGAIVNETGTTIYNPGKGGTGKQFDISGSLTWYAGGGGGGSKDGASVATGGNGGGGNGGNSAIGLNAAYATGGGGGGGGFSGNNDYRGGNGGSGVVILRWITAQVPTYTKPTTAYLNVGMTETFTTNVAQDSATAVLTRTFKWESTTPAANGAYTLIKQGTGAANAAFSWVPTDTTTSGSGYLYRLTVTDSDTAGLFITDSSTAFAVINRALVVSGASSFGKTINLAKSETYTITLGTPTYRASLSPTIAGITLETSTAGSAVIKISETMTVGTYYETLTVLDSVSASVVTPLTIVVAAPPQLTNTGEIVTDGQVFNLDFSNSASYNPTSQEFTDISGAKKTITAPNGGTYSNDFSGIYTLKTTSSQYLTATAFSMLPKWTIETYIRINETPTAQFCPFASEYASSSISMLLCVDASRTVFTGFFNRVGASENWSFKRSEEKIPLNTWVHIVGTFDGSAANLYFDGVSTTRNTGDGGRYDAGYVPPTPNTNRVFIGKDYPTSVGTTPNISFGFVRAYSSGFTLAQAQQNFNATKTRFLPSKVDAFYPSHKYGNTTTETFTITSGYGSDTISYATGNKAGVKLETTTSLVTLKMQESLTATTHYETITVTDSLGASTFLPIKMTVSKADTLTISMDTKTVVTYNGSPITSYPKPVIRGLAGLDTFTVTTKFSSSLYTKSAIVPTNSDTYTVIAEDPVFGIGALSNYVNVVYETSTAVVNKAKQPALSVFLYGGTVGLPFPITVSGGGGDGAISETVTAGSSMTGCAITNHSVSASSTSQGFCRVYIFKAASQNYLSESITVDMYFMAYINNQPTGLVGSGSTIAINGATSLTIDDTATVRAPNVTSLSVTSGGVGTVIHIYGGNFGAGPLSIKFNRNKIATGTVVSGNDITVTVPTGAITGPILVMTATGDATTPEFTVTP